VLTVCGDMVDGQLELAGHVANDGERDEAAQDAGEHVAASDDQRVPAAQRSTDTARQRHTHSQLYARRCRDAGLGLEASWRSAFSNKLCYRDAMWQSKSCQLLHNS